MEALRRLAESRGLFTRRPICAPGVQTRRHVGRHQDWAWEKHGVLGEFDGRVKYGRLLKPNKAPGDAVFREKVREDEIREMHHAQLIWSDLDDPGLHPACAVNCV